MEDRFKKELYYILGVFLVIMLGTYIRFKGYYSNPSFYFDESALVGNIETRNYVDLFKSLDYCQICPPLFLVLSKLSSEIFGALELSFRFIPFLFGCFSIVAFFFLAGEILKNKISVLFSLLLFAINIPIVIYSFTFKPYTVELFLTILLLLFFINLNLETLSLKKCLLFGVLISFVPWLGFSPVFIIAGGLLNMFFKNFKSSIRKKFCLSVPILLNGSFFLGFFLINYCKNNKDIFAVWSDFFKGFITLDSSFFFLAKDNIQWLFGIKQSSVLFIILMFLGAYILYKQKSEFLKISLISIVLMVILSFFHLYPFYQRFILFLLPILIILITKPLDVAIHKKNVIGIIINACFLIVLITQLLNLKPFLTQNYNKNFIHSYPRLMFVFVREHITQNDKIIINAESLTDFDYYYGDSYKDNVIALSWDKCKTKNTLKNLDQGTYWLCMPDNFGTITMENISSLKNIHVIKTYKMNKSYVLYIKV